MFHLFIIIYIINMAHFGIIFETHTEKSVLNFVTSNQIRTNQISMKFCIKHLYINLSWKLWQNQGILPPHSKNLLLLSEIGEILFLYENLLFECFLKIKTILKKVSCGGPPPPIILKSYYPILMKFHMKIFLLEFQLDIIKKNWKFSQRHIINIK